MPIKPDLPTPDHIQRVRPGSRGGAIRLLVLLLAGGLLSGCAQEAPRTGAPGEDARRALAEHRRQGPIQTLVLGNPFAMDQSRLDSLVTQAMAEGVTGLEVAFTAHPEQAAAAEPHLVVVLNPAREPPAFAACRDPQAIGTLPAAETLKVFAAFCQGDRPLDAVQEEGRVAGPTDRNFQRLLWRTSGALFPDDYPSSYGFGFLPRWLNLGVGGSFGL